MTPYEWHQRSEALEQANDRRAALALLNKALQEHPQSAELHNSTGSMAQRGGDAQLAEQCFARAMDLQPGNADFVINRAIALTTLDMPREAAKLLAVKEQLCRTQARYWSVRGNAERLAGQLSQASQSYDQCLALSPTYPKALHGRARLSLERGENHALAYFDRALAAMPGEADLWLGKAQALDIEGRADEARALMEQVVKRAPGWIAALQFLAQLRLAQGDADYAEPFRLAERAEPGNSAIWHAHLVALSGLDHHQQTLTLAAEARRRFPDNPSFALAEAVHAGSAGEHERAEAIFASLALEGPSRQLHEARHRLRRMELDAAERLLIPLTDKEASRHTAYTLLGFVWRLTGDARAEWLHEQNGLVQTLALHCDDGLIEDAIEQLQVLHDGSPLPLGQSLRGGSQTRHILFHRHEPVFATLADAIRKTLEEYRGNLPKADPTHPLLQHREDRWDLAGSWSVRLRGGGDYHASHIHPQGMLSSALYLIVPQSDETPGRDGWLELGRPPPDLELDLGPVQEIEPKRSHLALFPSTLYHGTRPFDGDVRMTVAFDVVAER